MSPALGSLRAAFEATGSPSWVMHVIRKCRLDHRYGFSLDLALGGDTGSTRVQATQQVLADGRADLIDTDWLSIARSRVSGTPLTAVFPYGRIMGGVVTATSANIDTLAQLNGRSVGVIRASDKNWAIVRAVCGLRHGFDPHEHAHVAEALSKSMLVDWLQSGRVDAAVLPWHLVPRLTAGKRFRQLCDVLDLLADLGIPPVPTTFFAVRPEFAAARRELLAAFIAAYCEAVSLMLADEDVWREAASLSGDDAEVLSRLRSAWKRRICTDWPGGTGGHLDHLFERLKGAAGEEALGVSALPRDLFAPALLH